MIIRQTGQLLGTTSKTSKQDKPYHISRVFIPEAQDVAEIFSNKLPDYKVGDKVPVLINVQLSGQKTVSCNFDN